MWAYPEDLRVRVLAECIESQSSPSPSLFLVTQRCPHSNCPNLSTFQDESQRSPPSSASPSMPSQPPIPPLLSPYVSTTPSTSLTCLTSTLAASTNWLVLRFIYAATKNASLDRQDLTQADTENTRIVLVSWLRDANFWREGGRKLVSRFAADNSTKSVLVLSGEPLLRCNELPRASTSKKSKSSTP